MKIALLGGSGIINHHVEYLMNVKSIHLSISLSNRVYCNKILRKYPNIHTYINDDIAIKNNDYIFINAPYHEVRDICESIKPILKPEQIIATSSLNIKINHLINWLPYQQNIIKFTTGFIDNTNNGFYIPKNINEYNKNKIIKDLYNINTKIYNSERKIDDIIFTNEYCQLYLLDLINEMSSYDGNKINISNIDNINLSEKYNINNLELKNYLKNIHPITCKKLSPENLLNTIYHNNLILSDIFDDI